MPSSRLLASPYATHTHTYARPPRATPAVPTLRQPACHRAIFSQALLLHILGLGSPLAARGRREVVASSTGPEPSSFNTQRAGELASDASDHMADSGEGSAPKVNWRMVSTAASVVASLVLIVGHAGPAHAETWDPRNPRPAQAEQDPWGPRTTSPKIRRQPESQERDAAERAAWKSVEADRKKMDTERVRARRRERTQLSQQSPYQVAGFHVSPLIFWGAILGGLYWGTQTAKGRLFVQQVKGRAQSGTQWVRDRSLGGRAVKVRKGAFASSNSFGAQKGLREEDFAALTSFAAAARSKVDVSSGFKLPAWWDPPVRTSPSSSPAQAEAQKRANSILNRLEQGVTGGRDYEMLDIVRLRETCQEGGVTVIPKTVGGRDGIFKAALEGALKSTMDPDADVDLGDASPTRFLSALAGDLNMPEQRAVSLVNSAVMAKCRSRLVTALSSLKAGDEMAVMMDLIPLASMLENMPVVEAGSKELGLIASSLSSTSSMDERKHILSLMWELYEEGGIVVAEMLGFDPQLAVESLKASKGKGGSA